MPRRICQCVSCEQRFIAPTLRGVSFCTTCSSSNSADDLLFSEDDACDACSEASDDNHCTQIVIGDRTDEDIDNCLSISRPKYEEPSTNAPTIDIDSADVSEANNLPKPFNEQPTNNDLMSCKVCGSLLVHITTWKGRLKHIKRCGKKHDFQAREVSYNDDFEIFTDIKNPYAKGEWHAGVIDDKANQEATNSNNAFGALMAGARRVAKIQKIQDEEKLKPKRKRGWFGPKLDYSNRTCPLYKKIYNTDFVVDGFYYAKPSLTTNYFLTHFHSDHYGGIDKSWDAGIIYCSRSTANLVNEQLGVDRKFLHPLPLLEPTIIASQGKAVIVTLIDANHCPGAVMLLFEVGNRKVLHVGDFRWNKKAMQEHGPLRRFISGQERIDDLYLDTTYCDAKYELPTQDEAIDAAIKVAQNEIESAKRTNTKVLLLFGAYTIGKERMYLSVAKHLGMKVYVDSRRLRIMKALEWSEDELSIFTTSRMDSQLWVVPLGHINHKRLPEYLTTGKLYFDRVAGFRPTGWSHSSKSKKIVNTISKGCVSVHNVPYSEHSSFTELVDCLACLRPKRIIPTVSVSRSQQQIELLLSKLRS